MEKSYETGWEFDEVAQTWLPAAQRPAPHDPYGLAMDVLPAGMTMPFAGAAVPKGWLLCDGSAVSRASYPRLYAAIGTTYGAGDGSTTFNVPNLKGRVVAMVDPAVVAVNTLGKTGGSRDSSLVSHSHTVNSHGHGFTTQGHHGHGFVAEAPATDSRDINHYHDLWTNGVNANHEHNVNSVVFMNCSATHGHGGGCGQLAESPSYGGCTGFGCTGGTAGQNRDHAHYAVSSWMHQNVTHAHTVNNHGHGFVAEGNHNHAFVAESPGTNSQGTAAADANMPPFMAMNYLIKA